MTNTPKDPSEDVLAGALGDFLGNREELAEWAMNDQGEKTATALARGYVILFQNSILYDLENRAIIPSANQVVESVNTLLVSSEEVQLRIGSHLMYVNGSPVKMDDFLFNHIRKMERHTNKLRLREINFTASITREDIMEVMAVVQEAFVRDDGAEHLAAAQFEKVTISDFHENVERVPAELQAIRAYFATLMNVRELVTSLERAKQTWLAPTKRAVQDLTAMCYSNSTILLGLIRLPHFQREHFNRLVNTSVICAVMCCRLGVNKRIAADLAYTACIHDLDWTGQGSVRETILEILRIYGRDPKGEWRTCLIADLNRPEGFSAAQIISVAAAYEKLASFGDIAGNRLRPDEALKRIQGEVGKLFSLVPIKLLINVLGLFPVGSLTELSSGHLAVVIEFPNDRRSLMNPIVRLIRGSNGQEIDEVVDLAEDKKMRVVRCLDPEDYNINVASFFVGKEQRKLFLDSLNPAGPDVIY